MNSSNFRFIRRIQNKLSMNILMIQYVFDYFMLFICLQNYQFSPEELRVLRECEVESFYQRSLPLGFGMGLGAFLGVRNGILKVSKFQQKIKKQFHLKKQIFSFISNVILKASVKFGPWPKVIGFSFLGYIAGRLSYQKTCQEKMLALPNSKFAELLRQRLNRSNKKWDSTDAGVATAFSLAPFQSNTDAYSDHNQVRVSLFFYLLCFS